MLTLSYMLQGTIAAWRMTIKGEGYEGCKGGGWVQRQKTEADAAGLDEL